MLILAAILEAKPEDAKITQAAPAAATTTAISFAKGIDAEGGAAGQR
ncbi:hypothetical protein [Borrelia sp. P9F1]|nr:hypothetical protein [Borrelia sp. P9F1]WKC58588.1 hypothetical protein QYZ68_05155 [Borrelia sp. P9F1]